MRAIELTTDDIFWNGGYPCRPLSIIKGDADAPIKVCYHIAYEPVNQQIIEYFRPDQRFDIADEDELELMEE